MKRQHVIATTLAVAAAVALILALYPRHSIGPEPKLPRTPSMPESALRTVRSAMKGHATQMAALVANVAVLDYDGVARNAGQIFDQPALARPAAGAPLDGLLPERFFTLQDELRARARDVVEAAARRDDRRLAAAFGALTSGCVACHSVYLDGARPTSSR